MQIQEINIPLSRVAVLIGEKGKTKKKIEKLTDTILDIDSKTGKVIVKSGKKPIAFYNCLSIIKAIGRGFSPENALLLLDDSFVLDIIELKEFGKSERAQKTKRARVIGTHGSFRKWMEKNLDIKLSIMGKTVSIIGKYENVKIARDALELLLNGAEHSSVYGFVKRRMEKPEFDL